MRVKSITLNGSEYKVDGLDETNALVINNSDSAIYASRLPNIEPYADGVIRISAGSRDTVEGANGTVYILGTGNVECRGVSYVNFRSPSSFGGSSGGGSGSDVSKDYVDEQDRTNLIVAKAYADVAVEAVMDDITKNGDRITELRSDLENANSTIEANTSLITTTADSTLTNANDYTNTKTNELDIKIEAVQSAISVLNGTDTGSITKTVADQISSIIANAPEDLDTLKEIADWISGHANDAAAMNSDISANTASISSIQNDISDIASAILQDKAETNSNIETLIESIESLIMSKADKIEIPTTLPANGGDADTVNGHTVDSDVPENAQFTDTTYCIATYVQDGLESKEDKTKLDSIETGANNYVLPTATSTRLGGIKIGDNLSVTVDGMLSAPFALEAIHQPAEQDLNDYVTPGVYYFSSSNTPANIPIGVNGFLLVLADTDERVKQIWFRQGTIDVNDYQTYVRMGSGSEIWGPWYRLLTDVDRITVGQPSDTTYGAYSTSEGKRTIASGVVSHAQGECCVTTGECAHAQGYATLASGVNSAAFGVGTVSDQSNQLVIGVHNKTGIAGSPFVIGGGAPASDRKTIPTTVLPTISKTYSNYIRTGNAPKNIFRVATTGTVYGMGEFNTSGADYAEYIKPWWDDNVDNEDRRGYFVTIKNGKLHKAEPIDYIVGITSGNPSVVGNGDEDWLGRWQRDEFNTLIYQEIEVDDYEKQEDENGNLISVKVGSHIENHTVEVPEYDPTQEYIERKDRPEWSCVGMIGVLPLRDDGTCVAGGFAKCGSGGIATAADEWSCHKTFFVIERINDHIISVEMR